MVRPRRWYRYTANTEISCTQCSGLVQKDETIHVIFRADGCDDVWCDHCYFDPEAHIRYRKGVVSCSETISGLP
jgi:hypothetical protein